jgi:hypothetical protein
MTSEAASTAELRRGLARRTISAVLPPAAKRAIDRIRMRRFLAIIAPANAEYVRRYGLEVRRGPFAGLHYLEGLERTSPDLITKVAGTYESELHAAFGEWVQQGIPLVVNVGCAEGYYAVGLARTMPQTKVLAYDILQSARSQCARMAAINGVAERVELHEACTPATLAGLPDSGVALLCDCEGYEKHLLDPELVPALRNWQIIVELHDFVDPTITETIVARFSASHDVELIPSLRPDSQRLEELDFMTPRQRRHALTERPVPMSWAHLRPR